MPSSETRKQLLAAVAACEDKKGEDTRILELDPADSGLADYFLITSATNDRQVVAISDEIEFRLKRDLGVFASSVEGRQQGEWILLDYVDIVIHVFLAERRAFYDIERLRKSARNLTAAEVEAELKAALIEKTREVRTRAPRAKTVVNKAAALKSTAARTAKPASGGSKVSAASAKKSAKKTPAKKAATPALDSAVALDSLSMKPPIARATTPVPINLAASSEPTPKKTTRKTKTGSTA